MIEQLFFELIQVSLGTRICLSHTPSADEWGELYSMAKKQSLVGVCFAGVQRLQTQQQCPDEMSYLTWMGMAAKIQQRNEVVNRQCVELQEKLSSDGFDSVIMKGQGVASLYKVSSSREFHVSSNLSLLRQSGDIDVLVDAELPELLRYVNGIAPTDEVDGHHVHFHVFKDTEVELHYVAANLPRPSQNRKLQAFFDSQKGDTETVSLGSGEIVVPSMAFQLVHLMVHIYHHFFTEGVGMRQLMDYYFVLKSTKGSRGSRVQEVQEVSKVINDLGLGRFAAGVMYIMQYVFGMDEDALLCPPDKKAGSMILKEVMARGNFGKMSDNDILQMNLINRTKYRIRMAWRYRYFGSGFWFWNSIYMVKKAIWQRYNNFK